MHHRIIDRERQRYAPEEVTDFEKTAVTLLVSIPALGFLLSHGAGMIRSTIGLSHLPGKSPVDDILGKVWISLATNVACG